MAIFHIIALAVRKKGGDKHAAHDRKFFYAIGGNEAVYFLDDVLLEPFVKIPWFENPIRSYRLQEKDIKAMSKKGYRIFDGDIGRFVKEWPASSRFHIREDR